MGNKELKTSKIKNAYNKVMSINFDFSSKLKYFLFATLILILTASIITTLFGFNKNIELGGGSMFTVKFDTEISNNQMKEYKNDVAKILEDKKINNYFITIDGEGHTNTLVVKFKNTKYSDEELQTVFETISENIENKLNPNDIYYGFEVSELFEVSPSVTSSFIWYGVLGLVVLFAIYSLYTLIRFDKYVFVTTMLKMLHDSLLVTALLLITRVELSKLIFLTLSLTLSYSFLLNVLHFTKAREGYLKEEFNGYTNGKVSSEIVKSDLIRNDVVSSLLMILGVTFLPLGLYYGIELGISLILLAFVVDYSSIFIAPSIWARIYNKENDKRLKNRLLQKEKENQKEEDKLVV